MPLSTNQKQQISKLLENKGEEYWNFLGGENTYKELLKVFDEVGKSYKDKILNKIQEVAKRKIVDNTNL